MDVFYSFLDQDLINVTQRYYFFEDHDNTNLSH